MCQKKLHQKVQNHNITHCLDKKHCKILQDLTQDTILYPLVTWTQYCVHWLYGHNTVSIGYMDTVNMQAHPQGFTEQYTKIYHWSMLPLSVDRIGQFSKLLV